MQSRRNIFSSRSIFSGIHSPSLNAVLVINIKTPLSTFCPDSFSHYASSGRLSQDNSSYTVSPSITDSLLIYVLSTSIGITVFFLSRQWTDFVHNHTTLNILLTYLFLDNLNSHKSTFPALAPSLLYRNTSVRPQRGHFKKYSVR